MTDPKLKPGTNYCLCAGCGEYFTSDHTFKMHRVGAAGKRRCRDPAKILDRSRKPRLRMATSGHWASARRRTDIKKES